MDYRSALAFLDEHTNLAGSRSGRFTSPLPTAGQVDGLSLDAMVELMAALGDPHKAYRTIHITGTNGKGSTARAMAAILRQTDLSVGIYTSPDLSKINERINWDGHDISDEDFARVMDLLAAVEPVVTERAGKPPSRFEVLTALAFVHFAEQGTEVAVIEVGLLGRYDATNVIDADVAVITNVGKDHTDGAEGWPAVVAEEKAGIIKPNSHVVLGSDMGDLQEIFEAEESAGIWSFGRDFTVDSNELAVGGRVIDIRTPGEFYEQVFLPFHGAHQGDNMATAVAAVEAFFQKAPSSELIEEALSTLELPGRFEVVGHDPIIILDGAHNPHGAEAAYDTLIGEFARLGSWVLVIGMLTGKDPVEMLQALHAPDFDAVICTEPDWSRAMPAEEIAAAAAALGIKAEIVRKPIEAVNRALAVTASDDLIMIAGTTYFLGDIRSALFF